MLAALALGCAPFPLRPAPTADGVVQSLRLRGEVLKEYGREMAAIRVPAPGWRPSVPIQERFLLLREGAEIRKYHVRVTYPDNPRRRHVVVRLLYSVDAGGQHCFGAENLPLPCSSVSDDDLRPYLAATAPRPALLEPPSPSAPPQPAPLPLPPAQAPLRDGAVALIIGVERYRYAGPAEFAARDALAVRDYAIRAMGFAPEHVRHVEDATRADLQAEIEEWLPRNARKDSLIFVYFSGHGAADPHSGEVYLLPHDGRPGSLQTTGYPLRGLMAALDRLPGQVLLVVDACYTGVGPRSARVLGERPLVAVTREPVAVPERVVLLAGARAHETSGAYREKHHGLFTYFFLQALRGEAALDDAGWVTLGAIARYLERAVPRQAALDNRDQHPWIAPAVGALGAKESLRLSKVRP
jgi:hypothetical protein